MALTPQNNEAFIREVDEELRREQMSNIGKRYGLWIIVAVLVALAAFGGWTWWNHHQNTLAGEQGEQLATALDDIQQGRVAQATEIVGKLTSSDKDALRATALLTQADMLLSKNDTKGAAAAFGWAVRFDGMSVASARTVRMTVRVLVMGCDPSVDEWMVSCAVAGRDYLPAGAGAAGLLNRESSRGTFASIVS